MKTDESTEKFYPNKLKIKDLENLEDWQLLIATCHFAPQMGDCVELNYGYEYKEDYDKNNYEYRKGIWMNDVCLNDDIDMNDKLETVCSYLRINWKDLCRDYLKTKLK